MVVRVSDALPAVRAGEMPAGAPVAELKPGTKICGRLPFNGYGVPRCSLCNDNGFTTVTVIASGVLHTIPRHGHWTEWEGRYYQTGGQRLEPCVCNQAARQEAEARRQDQLARSGLLNFELDRCLADIIHRGEGSARMLEAVQAMAGQAPFGMLTLWGGPGNGKTLALQALTNEFLHRSLRARYRTLAQLLNELRAGYADGQFQKDRLYEEFASCQFLAIDEFDKPRMTDFAREIVFDLIDDRYRRGMQPGPGQLFTALAMNLSPDCLPPYLFSRLRWGEATDGGFRIVQNTDDDFRQTGL